MESGRKRKSEPEDENYEREKLGWTTSSKKAARLMGLQEVQRVILPQEITKKILEHLEVRQLKSCRLVCKAWNKDICELVKGKLITRIHSEKVPEELSVLKSLQKTAQAVDLPSALEELWLRFPDEHSPGIRKALGNPFSLPSFFITKITILSNDFLDPNEYLMGDCTWILEQCAHSLVHLDLSGVSMDFFIAFFPSTDECENDNNTSGEDVAPPIKFPRLESLSIQLDTPFFEIYQDRLEYQYLVQDLLQQIMEMSPKLHNLKLVGGCESGGIPHVPGLRPSILQKIQHLEIVFKSIAFQELLHQEKVPPLKALVLSCQSFKEGDSRWLSSTLSRFAPTLEFLELRDNSWEFSVRRWGEDEEEDFPFFPQLRTLSFVGKVQLGETWLSKTPVLKELRIQTLDLRYIPKHWELDPNLQVFSSVEKICAVYVKLPNKHLEQVTAMAAFRRIFPNVTRWRVVYYQEPFLQFAVSEHAQYLGLFLEELECYVDDKFPPGCLKGLKRLGILYPYDFSGDPRRKREELRQHEHLPHLQDVSFHTKMWYDDV